ncbi:hypothetical protein C1645_855872 [Glomus cerebriforme]|uniref:Uncharacterized protein n=1 Tax=Glomus cerebriforme TaxID=658196 RepID=A0A397SNY2_9GLOM|nr:hypothetical protein C1645_855872 [Glomus cerebriforme]
MDNCCFIKRPIPFLFLNFIIWNIASIPLVPASIAPYVDETYSSKPDLYDALLNTFFPISFVILLNASGESGSIKNKLLPLLDDVLYNTITWVIPLIVSFSYGDLLAIKIFSIINMCLHVICAITAIFKREKIGSCKFNGLYVRTIYGFLILFPVIVIPAFWIINITTRHTFDSINMMFLIIFGFLLVSLILYFVIGLFYINLKIASAFLIIFFYAPNILQTLLIALYWPINFYFVKACVFILVLSLTRNVSYFTDKVPDEFLATSTTITQAVLREFIKEQFGGGSQIEIIDEKIDDIKISIDKKDNNMNEIRRLMMDEVKNSMMDEVKRSMTDEVKRSMMNEVKRSLINEVKRSLMDEVKNSINEMKKNS